MTSGSSPRLLLVDLDNTVYDWIGLYAATLRAMVKALAPRLGLSERDLQEQFRSVYAKRRSLEYAFLVQEIDACGGRDPDEIYRFVDAAHRAYKTAAAARLRAYPGVREALVEAKAAGLTVCGISNAPAYQAQSRLRKLGLGGLFDGLGVWQGFEIPDGDPYAREVQRRVDAGRSRPAIRAWTFPETDLKPTPAMYEQILHDLAIAPTEALAVGDSIRKDLAPAAALGIEVAWAEYGTRVDPDDLALVVAMTPWSRSEVSSEYGEKPSGFSVLESGWDFLVWIRKMVGAGLHSGARVRRSA